MRRLAAGYGKKQIVHGIDLALGRGEILLVLGHNGAGKTTLMRAIFGLLKPTGGEVPTERILLTLAANIGLPYFLLSSTEPLLQGWFARANPFLHPATRRICRATWTSSA